MAKKKKHTEEETEAATAIHTHSREGERHVILGFIQLILVVAFVVGSFMISAMLKASKEPVGERAAENRVLFAETKMISPAPYRIAFKTTGVVGTRSDVSVVPQVGGKVVSVNEKFYEGGSFEADEVLFEVEAVDFELELRRLQSSVAQARTAYNLEEAESSAAIAEWQQIHPDKPTPYLVARKPQKAEAWANLKAAKAQLENARLDLKRAKFSLPFAGRVLSANLEVGQVISAGQSYGSVYDVQNLEVQTSLKDEQLNWLLRSETPDITIRFEHLGEEKTAKGILKRGASSLNSRTRFAAVSIGFETPPDNLIPGIFVELDVKGPIISNALSIPATALQKGQKIWSLDSESKLQAITQEIAFSNDEHVIIQSSNALSIVTSKMPGAIEGMLVKTADDTKDNKADE